MLEPITCGNRDDWEKGTGAGWEPGAGRAWRHCLAIPPRQRPRYRPRQRRPRNRARQQRERRRYRTISANLKSYSPRDAPVQVLFRCAVCARRVPPASFYSARQGCVQGHPPTQPVRAVCKATRRALSSRHPHTQPVRSVSQAPTGHLPNTGSQPGWQSLA